ncbi:MAG: LysR family transcriptional regulator [Lachnospiraceae bacterium]|nr:LysR family transcriptional regulator [Lachnospiraceae bacterium]
MNTTQIKCFLAVAETLNFTKAAKQLFITQPGLSRQIVSLERELNTLLFIRDKQSVRLTPAAAVLAKELQDFESRLEEILHKAQKIGQGYSGRLVIGMLGGQYVNEELTDKLMRFMQENPNIDLVFKQGSFRDLREWVIDGSIDIAYTLNFDVHDMKGIVITEFCKDSPVFAISRHTGTGRKKKVLLNDLMEETLIIISPDDSRAGYELIQAFLKRSGVSFSDIRYAPNLATIMMWIEAGQGVGIINHNSNITSKTSIRLLENIVIDTNQQASSCFIWKAENYNPAIPLFVNPK